MSGTLFWKGFVGAVTRRVVVCVVTLRPPEVVLIARRAPFLGVSPTKRVLTSVSRHVRPRNSFDLPERDLLELEDLHVSTFLGAFEVSFGWLRLSLLRFLEPVCCPRFLLFLVGACAPAFLDDFFVP